MTRIEEKLYLQSVFDAIDEVYKVKNHQQTLTYEERLRASFNKLLIPDWYNHDYTSINELRKTKSHGQVSRTKRYDKNNNHYQNGTSNTLMSSSTHSSNGTNRYRTASHSWSERPTLRRNSTASSYDTNGSVIINGRRSTNSNGMSTYATGIQRVAQSSTWYKPKTFTITNGNNQLIQPPKPLPRYSKIDQERINSTDFSLPLSTSKPLIAPSISNGNVRHPIKPRTMAQAPIPTEAIDEESSLLNVSLDISSDGDITVVQKPTSSRPSESSSSKPAYVSLTPHRIIIDKNNMTTISRTDSSKSISSDGESYSSAMLPPLEKNLLITDSSSYNSVNDQCLSTSSYHTAVGGDTSSSATGYETPTPQLDNDTLSSHSSVSDLSFAETLEPNTEDLDVIAVSTEEQKPAIIPSVDVGMENLPLPPRLSTLSNASSSSLSDNSPSTESRLIENTNWYDDGSIETCIHQTTSSQIPSIELREIPNDDNLHEIDMNGAGDEFFVFSPRNTTDDEPSSSMSDDKHIPDFEKLESPTHPSKRLYTMENKNEDLSLTDDFLCSSTVDPFGFNNNNSSPMITNLDDLLIDDDDDGEGSHLKDSSTYLLNTNYRRPIQEDILYEVEHENSFSDHSQNTSSIAMPDDNTSIKPDPNWGFLTREEPIKSDVHQSTLIDTTSVQEKQSKYDEINSRTKQSTNDTNTLPIYYLPPPPLYTSSSSSSSLRIDTSMNPYKLDLSTSLSSPSSYTPKIRNRHFSVGSYYDNKTTTVTIHPNHTLYIIGSAPVSPLSRASTTSSESHYHLHHHSPVSYGNIPLNALRRVNPFLETNSYTSNYEYQRSSSLNRDDDHQRTFPINQTEPTPTIPRSTSSPPSSTHKSSVTFSQYEKPKSPSPPPRPQFEQEPPLVRPKTSRGRPRSPPPPPAPPSPPPPRASSIEEDQTQNIYQEIDNVSTTDDDNTTTPNTDLQFIRGTIKRVFDFHAGSPSESSTTNYEEISEDIKNDNESISLSTSSKTLSKKNTQYPAVEAVQRFYHTKSPSSSEKNNTKEQTTNLDDNPASNHSSTSNKLYARSHPMNVRKKDSPKSKSSDNEQASSEEVDDTLNDIEEDDYQDEKLKRQAANNSSHTSNENSPLHSSDNQMNIKKTSQETQTSQRPKSIRLTAQSPSGSQSTVQSYETARSSIPPIDIVTQMVIERNDSIDDGQIDEISGDIIIYYDDIEIVEHSPNMSSTESDTTSSRTKSFKKPQPVQTIVQSQLPPPPPIPARTLKPLHLLDNQQQSPATPRTQSSSKINRTYELEKAAPIRKKCDVNSVNDMLNRTDYYIGPTVTHRLPSARHFVGKLNSDDTSSRHSSITNTNIIPKPSSITMVKSQTLPLQPVVTNGHSKTNNDNNNQRSPTKSPFSTLPTRSSSSAGTNEKHRTILADTNALVKQIQNSLSRNSLHDSQVNSPLSISTKDLRTFVSSTYSPSDENIMDDDGVIHSNKLSSNYDDQAFKRQARLSKSFHNVSEYNCIDQYPKKENGFTSRTQPSKSVENNLNKVTQNQTRHSQIPLNFPPVVSSTSFSALPHSEDHARMLSMKWYTGQVSENSEICYNTPHVDNDDLLYGYVSAHSNRETQLLLARLQASNDIRIHAALDDIRLRVSQFDSSKSPEDLHVFMRYLESRLRDINNKNSSSSTTTTTTTTSNRANGHRKISNGGTTNGYHNQQQQSDSMSIKSRTSSIATGASKETPPPRQFGRQHLRSSGNLTGGGGGTNGHQPPPPPRRASQSSVNQENPAVFDDMLNTVLGLPKKGASTLPPTYSSSSQSREKLSPLTQTQFPTNTTGGNKTGRDSGKRLFESGTYKDPRLIYDGPKKNEKEEQPLETSV